MKTLRAVVMATFFCVAVALQAAAGRQVQGENSLHAMKQQCEQARSLSHYDQLERLSTHLYNRAREESDRRYEAYALFYRGLSQLFTGNGRKSVGTFEQARRMAEDIGNDSIVALVMNAVGIYHAMDENNSFMAQQYFFRSLRYADKAGYDQLKGRVYGNMIILTQSGNDTTGLDNAFKIYQYGREQKDYEQTFMGAYYLAMYYNLRGDNVRAEQYLEESLQLHAKYPYEDVAAVYTLYAKVKLDSGDKAKALDYARQAVSLAQRYHQAGLLPDAYLQQAAVYHAMGDYRQSNLSAETALKTAEEAGNRSKTIDCLQLLADNCRKLGDNNAALNHLERANRALDTLTRINMDRLMHERSIMLDMEQKEQEATLRKQQMDDQRKLNIVLVVTTIILAVLLSVIVANYRRRNRLYKNIVSQNARAVDRQKQLEKRIDKLKAELSATQPQPEAATEPAAETGEPSPKSAAPTPNTLLQDDERMQDVYERACMLMDTERLYADSQLTRERLAERLGTNRTYLSRIIKEKSGMNYLQFVNSYRINEAVRILSDRDQVDYPLKQIWSDLGFNSPATFYKLFQQTVGITPSVYRKQFMDIT